MWIEVGNLKSRVLRGDDRERRWLSEYLSFEDPRAKFRRRGRDARVRMLNPLDNTFASGFVSMIRKAAPDEQVKIDLVDHRAAPCAEDASVDLAWLRDYQAESVRRVVEKVRGILWLPTGCLVGDTKIVVNRAGAARPVEIKTIVKRMLGEATRNRAGKLCSWDLRIPTLVQSVDSEGFLRLRPISAVHDNGIAEVFEIVTASGRVIRATAEHHFLTDDGWTRLKDLSPGVSVRVMAWPSSFSRQVPKRDHYAQTGSMFNHPFAQITNSTRDGRIARVPTHRLIAEARENHISLAEFVGRIVLGETNGLAFLDPDKWHVHHKNEIKTDNHQDNLEVISPSDHLRRHGKTTGWKHVSGRTEPDKIISITRSGEEPVYDLTVDDLHSYVAAEFVVHNSGKTEIACGLAKLLPCQWLFLAHRGNLLDQAAERWERRTGTPAGRVGDGCWQVERFTVATFQTLHARLKADPNDPEALALLRETQGLIADEAHTMPADSFWRIAMSTPNAYWRVGMSGTPLARGDRRSLLTVAATGPVIHRVRPEVLIEAGVLSRPKIRMVAVEQEGSGGSWADTYRELVVRSAARNAIVARVTTSAAKPSILFVKEIEHGRVLESMLRRAGVRCEFVWGSDSTDERKAAVRRLVRRDVDVLIASVVFNEGVDIPELRSVVVASGGRSVIAALQRVGRGMRVQKDARGNVVKDEFEVWDVLDRGDRWLQRHARARVKAYASEGHETVTVEPSQLKLPGTAA